MIDNELAKKVVREGIPLMLHHSSGSGEYLLDGTIYTVLGSPHPRIVGTRPQYPKLVKSPEHIMRQKAVVVLYLRYRRMRSFYNRIRVLFHQDEYEYMVNVSAARMYEARNALVAVVNVLYWDNWR